ncbi:translation elongation factor Ts [Sphingomonas glaciei]|uniref:Elongation factor Ts n=1 Tax=Sphingomonas glaciei TaxID=2938948 RepID=A0ABY5MVW9_9SPHN|nr:translation elongation factor Ts [Sphingomonas glaciei]UUR08592.1 translation elongation factor Ts [Sphingomonas glaciei]
MADITAAMVKELRERSGAGMMDCKKALAENNGDVEASIDWLRAKGLASAGKKAGRTAAEGLVGVAVEGNKGVVVEVNSETDFVAKNEQFQGFVRDVTSLALTNGDDVETLKKAAMPSGKSVEEALTENIATIGENQNLRRAKTLTVGEGKVVAYVHNAAAPGMGKIGVLVAIEGDAPADKLEALGKQIAMHIAAANPLALTGEAIDPAVIEREAAIAREKNADKIAGKPADIAEKILKGPVDKFRKESALLTQAVVFDGKTPVQDYVAAEAKAAGGSATIVDFVRFQLGEGIEKAQSDFAAEVAAASGVKQG